MAFLISTLAKLSVLLVGQSSRSLLTHPHPISIRIEPVHVVCFVTLPTHLANTLPRPIYQAPPLPTLAAVCTPLDAAIRAHYDPHLRNVPIMNYDGTA